MQTVGEFTLNSDGTLVGPAEYLREQGDAKLTEILAGDSAGFNAMLACAPTGTSVEQVVLVALQTDYAGWRGMRQTLAGLR